jgi:HEAT repeat protein
MSTATERSNDYRNDPRPTEELIRIALTETDEDAAWKPVTVLHYRGSAEVLSHAQRLCTSTMPKERILGANILGQLGIPARAFPEECFHTMAEMLRQEEDPDVLNSVGIAFGHLKDARAVPLLAPLAQHPSADVRFGVVCGVSCQSGALAIQTLILLSRDEDDHVRDWATFGLGSLTPADTPEIREALIARLSDSRDDAMGEALVGLALRHDERALKPLIEQIQLGDVGTLLLEAAEAFADPRLLPALTEIKDESDGDDAIWHGYLDRALAACSHSSELGGSYGPTITPE